MSTATVNGVELPLGPLKSLQVADMLDDMAGDDKSNAAMIRRSLKVVAQSLANGGNPQSANPEEAAEALNNAISYPALERAFLDVLEVTGLRKPATEGEAPAAESTTGESSAAS